MRKPPRPVKLGRKERMTFSQIDIDEVNLMPNLIGIQTDSYKWFVEKGLKEAFDDISPIQDPAGTWTLEFLDYEFDNKPKYDQEECKAREATYSVRLKVQTRLINNITRAVIEQPVFMGDFPLMTEKGTFVYNGAERVVVTQLVRSPGPYYTVERDRDNNPLYFTQIIPNRGAWIEYETDDKGVLYAKLDRKHKLPLTTFVRALGIGTTEEIHEIFGEDPLLDNTLEKEKNQFGRGRENIDSYEEGLKRLYAILRPSDPATVEDAQKHIDAILYDPRRYDLARVGRFKYNRKLGLTGRIEGLTVASPVMDMRSGEILADAGEIIDREKARLIENAGVGSVDVKVDDTVVRVVGNRFVDLSQYVNPEIYKDTRVENRAHYPVLMEILDEGYSDEELREVLIRRRNDLYPRHILLDDILASVSYLLNIKHGIGHVDDIDHLGNRRLRTVGELLQNQFRIGLTRMERVVKERMGTQDAEDTSPQALINIKPVTAAVREFFGSSQLSQFMDQCNPLAELTHKRRLSALGPGGLTRERAGFDVRDVHDSHYGRMCPIETPEGPNIGLIGSLATYGVVNEYGFIETPYRKVDKGTGIVTDQIDYITADEEEMLIVAQANEELDSDGRFINRKVAARGPHGEIDLFDRDKVDYMDVSPRQVVSVATAMIPFLENDDANRALMGSNMQRQAVPLLVTEAPRVGTGMEYIAAKDSGAVVSAKNSGTVKYVDADRIIVQRDDGGEDDVYRLIKFKRSNQQTCINQKPIVFHGEHVDAGEIIADGPSTSNGEVALGKNLLIGFMTWEGYNYEDAIILNERLIMEDVLTSIHIESYETDARDTKLGPEEITRDIANLSEEALKDLDEDGIIRIGAEVKAKDILVGKVTPKGETVVTPQEKLLRAVFGEKGRDVKDTSKTVPHGESGIVVDVKVFKRENGDELPPGVNERVRCYIATKRKIQVGDKMAGRHGNKGVISKILPEEDMPFLEDGTPLQVMLNPLGVPSRMNVGQVLEVHLGLVADHKDWYVATPVFDGAKEEDIVGLLKECGFSETGKMRLRDGRTGEYFDNPVTVGYMYMLKLHHLVDDKIHARSDGPYSLVTQQPLGGKAQFGGQRFGEMEVWALEAYGAAYTLQEILTVKSDDIVGRVKTYEAIVKGENIPEAGMPESFKVLIKELQALGLDAKILSADDQEIEIKDSSNEPGIKRYDEAGLKMSDLASKEDLAEGFSVLDEDGNAEELTAEAVEPEEDGEDFANE